MSNLSRLMVLATLAMLATAPAKADSIKFFTGTTGYTGPFSGVGPNVPGIAYQTIQNNTTACPAANPGCGAADIISPSQNFTSVGGQGLTASASTASVTAAVWNDLQPPFGGLGVQSALSPGDDQINPNEFLTITFSSPVTLTGVATLFDPNHTPFGPSFPTNAGITGTNEFTLNGTDIMFGTANAVALSITGTVFTFGAINGQPSYYVGGLIFQPVPIPGAAWLFASGIAGIAALTRRRRKNQSAIAA